MRLCAKLTMITQLATLCIVVLLLAHGIEQADARQSHGPSTSASALLQGRKLRAYSPQQLDHGRQLRQTPYATGLILPEGPLLRNSAFRFKANNCPESLDWRNFGYLTPVKNQGGCGSCWSFAATAAMEALYTKTTNQVSMSEQQLVDCDTESFGCNGGWYKSAWKLVSTTGAADEANYPYQGVQGTCAAPLPGSPVMPISGYEDVPTNEDDLLQAVCNQPVAVAIHASGEFMGYQAGTIFSGPCSSDPKDLNHAVVVVGYGQENGVSYWVVRNSWGEGWGEAGYIRMQMGVNICGIMNVASYPKAADPTPTPAPSGCAAEYTVVSGDTLSNIADANGVSLQDILDVNPQIVDPDWIYVDDTINIPPCTDIPQVVAPSVDCGREYLIVEGDYLYKIAQDNGITVGDLLAANPKITNPDLILTGDTLVIPQVC